MYSPFPSTPQKARSFFIFIILNIYLTGNNQSTRSAAIIAKSRKSKDFQTTERY